MKENKGFLMITKSPIVGKKVEKNKKKQKQKKQNKKTKTKSNKRTVSFQSHNLI